MAGKFTPPPIKKTNLESNLTHVGFSRYHISPEGVLTNVYTGNVMWPHHDHTGYVFHRITDDDNKSRYRACHRLVAFAHVPNPHGYEEVDHLDGNKDNNHASNLEWVTSAENYRRSMCLGLRHTVIKNESEVHEICRALENNERIVDISKRMNIPYDVVKSIKRRRNWTRISENYNF